MMPRRAACPGWGSHRQASKPAEVALREELMRLAPLYRIRFTYPESWAVSLDGGWQQLLFLAEGRCEGWISGRFRGANFPRRHGAEGPFRPDFRRQPNDCAHGQPLSRLSESGPWRRLAAASRQAAMTGQPVTVNVPDPTLPLW
jgi:hypothetical protein